MFSGASTAYIQAVDRALGFWIRPHSAAHAFGVACAVDSAVRVRESMIESGYLRYRSPGSCSGTDIRPPIEAEYRIYRFLSGPHVVFSKRLEGCS